MSVPLSARRGLRIFLRSGRHLAHNFRKVRPRSGDGRKELLTYRSVGAAADADPGFDEIVFRASSSATWLRDGLALVDRYFSGTNCALSDMSILDQCVSDLGGAA